MRVYVSHAGCVRPATWQGTSPPAGSVRGRSTLSPYNSGTVTAPLPSLILYGRQACHLCDEARAAITMLLNDRRSRGLPVPEVVERDIDTDEDLHRAFAFTIPVVDLGPSRLELAISPARIRRLLSDVLDGPGVATATGDARAAAESQP
jgi:hypothetical protein